MPVKGVPKKPPSRGKRSITARFSKRGRSSSRVLDLVLDAASKEIQLGKIGRLLKEGCGPKEIHEKLVDEHGINAYTFHTVVYYRRKQLAKMRGEYKRRRGRPPRMSVSEKIRKLREGGTRVSVKKTSKLIREPLTTTYRHFLRLGGKYTSIWRKPHKLTSVNKNARIEAAKKMLEILSAKRNHPIVITGDESWIYLSNIGRCEWVLPGETPTDAVKIGIASKKVMLLVFFSSSGIQHAEFLPQGSTVTADYFCGVLERLVDALPHQASETIWLHIDNARPHRARKTASKLKELGLTATPHPAYSPDLAPCDFWLFGRIKGSLEGREFQSLSELETAILSELAAIPKGEFVRVYNRWVCLLEQCLTNGGAYVV